MSSPAAAIASPARRARSRRSPRGSSETLRWAARARATRVSRAPLSTGAEHIAAGVPPGLLVRGPRPALRAAFAGLIDLQPIAWGASGLLCAPRSAPEQAVPAIARCPFPLAPLAHVPAHPEPAARLAGGWYVRSPAHAPAPPGLRELVEAPGEGFGPLAHPSTAGCLSLIDLLPAAPALDAGCGSGLLTQAWRALGRGAVHAIDADPRAIAHAEAGLRAAGRAREVAIERKMIESLPPAALAGRVVLANLPPPAHRALMARVGDAPAGVLLAGARGEEMAPILAHYLALGLRPAGATGTGPWRAWALVAESARRRPG